MNICKFSYSFPLGQEKKSSKEVIESLSMQLEISQSSLGNIQKEYSYLEGKNNELIRKMHEQMVS